MPKRTEMIVRTLFALYLILQAKAHMLGLHGLSGETPAFDPVLPEITGPFRFVAQVSFQDLPVSDPFFWVPTNNLITIFHWIDESSGDFIFFGHRNRGSSDEGARTTLKIKQGGGSTQTCKTLVDLAVNVVYTFAVSVTSTGEAVITVQYGNQGVSSATCNGMPVPGNDVERAHYLGESPSTYDYDDLDGGISGIQLSPIGGAHPRETLKFWNFPGQPFQKGFVVSFYARFDDLSVNSEQTVFDFGSSANDNNIRCGQWGQGGSAVMRCSVYDNAGVPHHVDSNSATGPLEQDQFAFWHFGVDASGNYWLEKNGDQVGSAPGVLPNNVFRSSKGSFIIYQVAAIWMGWC